MSWAEIKKAVNSDLNKPLNELIEEKALQIGIKSVQRGERSSAGNVSISSVNMAKSFVISVSKGSDGYVAARGAVSGSISGNMNTPVYQREYYGYAPDSSGRESYSSTLSGNLSSSISGGNTNLTTKQYSARLISSTTLSCDGPCEWQVIEFY